MWLALAHADLPPPVEAYTPVADVEAGGAALVEAHPSVVTQEVIGHTRLGRPIHAWHVADPDRPVTCKVLVFGGLHALEWISTETAWALLQDLAVAPVPGVSVTVVPVVNVDGRRRAEQDVRAGENTYRRGNAAQVDLNRDFAVNRDSHSVWRHVLPGYHSTTESALSQPETRSLDALADRERYDRAASLHSFGGYLYTPWAGAWRRPDDWAELHRLGRAMEAAQGPYAYRTRQLSRWGFFFRAHGAEIDHLYGEYGTLAFLVELTRSGFDLRRPAASLREYARWYNPRDPHPHVRRGLDAMWALLTTPTRSPSTGP